MSKHKNKLTKEQQEELQNIWKSDLSVIEAIEKRNKIVGEPPLTLDEKQQLEQQFGNLAEAVRIVANKYRKKIVDNYSRYRKVSEAISPYFKKEGKILPPEHKDIFWWLISIRHSLGKLSLPDFFDSRIPKIEDIDFELYHQDRVKIISNLQPPEKKKPELTNKLILFDSPETIELLFDVLKGYFHERDYLELKKALNGERLIELLLFPHNQNKFVEVFRRLKYNHKIVSSFTEIKDWICTNFMYRYKIRDKVEAKHFNKSTVWDILAKGRGEPKKIERICNADWLPYKSHLQLQREAEKEQYK